MANNTNKPKKPKTKKTDDSALTEKEKTELQELEEQLKDSQKLFCRFYVMGTMSNKECYLSAYPNCSETSADVNASRLLRNPKVKRYINLLLDELGESVEISDKEIIRELKRIAFNSKNDNAKIKALQTLGNITGLLAKEQKTITNNVITISVDDSHNNSNNLLPDTNNQNTIPMTTFSIIDDPDDDDDDDAN